MNFDDNEDHPLQLVIIDYQILESELHYHLNKSWTPLLTYNRSYKTRPELAGWAEKSVNRASDWAV